MSNLNNIKTESVNISRAESEQGYILYFSAAADGGHQFVKSAYPAAVIEELSSGVYDRNPVAGMRLVAALWTGKQAEDFTLSARDNMTVWRWVVATLFTDAMAQKNGTMEVADGEGGTVRTSVFADDEGRAMNVWPSGVRLALAVQVEDVAYQHYAPALAEDMVLHTYREMVAIKEGILALSEYGDTMFTLLHRHFLHVIETGNFPAAPVHH